MICFCKVRLRVNDPPSVRLKLNDLHQIRFSQNQYILVRGGDYDRYTGEYVVVPKSSTQTLETNDKLMTDDVSVLAIPYTEVTNQSGGYTVSIG